MEELCWEGLPVGPNIFITQDLLHGCYKFIWDHLAEWLNHTIGEKELDFQFKAQPKLGFLMGSLKSLKPPDANIRHISSTLFQSLLGVMG